MDDGSRGWCGPQPARARTRPLDAAGTTKRLGMGADKGNARHLHPCHVANGSLTAGAGRAGGWVAGAARAFLPLLAHRAKGAACRNPFIKRHYKARRGVFNPRGHQHMATYAKTLPARFWTVVFCWVASGRRKREGLKPEGARLGTRLDSRKPVPATPVEHNNGDSRLTWPAPDRHQNIIETALLPPQNQAATSTLPNQRHHHRLFLLLCHTISGR